MDFDATFPNAAQKALSDGGRYLSFEWTTRDFQNSANNKCWRDVASGSQDANIIRVAGNLKAFGRKLFFIFEGEPEGNDGPTCDAPNGVYGTPAEYVAAWRHIQDVFRAQGVTNAVYVMSYANPSSTTAAAFWPGDATHKPDWIGWDPYNWVDCSGHPGTWVEFADKAMPFVNWCRANHPGLPLMINETGSDEPVVGSGKSKGDWFRRIAADLAARAPEIKAWLYFDRPLGDCAFRVDSSADSLAGWKAMGANPYFNQPHF